MLPGSLSVPSGPDRPEDRADLDNPVAREAPVPACLRPGPLDLVVREALWVREVPEIPRVLSGLVVPGDPDFHRHRRKVRAVQLVPEVRFVPVVPVLPQVPVCRRDPEIREAHSGPTVPAGPLVPEVRLDLQVLVDR